MFKFPMSDCQLTTEQKCCLGLEWYQACALNTQYFGPLPMPVSNTNTNTGYVIMNSVQFNGKHKHYEILYLF